MVVVIIMESEVPPSKEERCWNVEEFDTIEEAEQYVKEFNEEHKPTEEHDWYMYAFIEDSFDEV